MSEGVSKAKGVFDEGVFLSRVGRPQVGYPRVVTAREGRVINITAEPAPAVRDICEVDDPAGYVKSAEVELKVEGEFRLEGHSSMSRISRTPESLVAAAIGEHHQCPDGLVLYLGTMFAP